MSVALFLAVAGGAGLGGWLAGRIARGRARAAAIVPALPWGVPFALGDVLVRGPDDEALLVSALVLRDGASVTAVLFSAPRRASEDRLVLVFPPPAGELLWLAPAALGDFVEPPTSLPLEPPLQRISRAAVSIEREGEGAPDLGRAAILATYRDSRGRAAIVLRGEALLVALGDAVPLEAIDRLPGR